MKRAVVELDDELHRKLKIHVLKSDKSVKQYVTQLIEKDLETKKEQTH